MEFTLLVSCTTQAQGVLGRNSLHRWQWGSGPGCPESCGYPIPSGAHGHRWVLGSLSWRQPAQGFKAPSNPSHSLILWFCIALLPNLALCYDGTVRLCKNNGGISRFSLHPHKHWHRAGLKRKKKHPESETNPGTVRQCCKQFRALL